MTDDVIATRTRALAGALAESGFARLRVREGETEIELRRSPRSPSPSASAQASRHDADAPTKPSVADRTVDAIASDVVGIVRMLRPAVSEGQMLEGDRDLAYVETLGIRNPVRSRGPGRIATIFVTEGQPVEYGQTLFAIER
ncbi:hypothetical protein WPS_23370 [Vulcanimicrobium alpinum]|uniref:Lipoyl-binding domain-containing protein n=1 Tax=Vulcanimicrobium alpinum TaxID=3016050 RepID=A0AAN2CAG0_UNVUL|nr:biotin/lipoyl-binding protein [Vulcanimicrobium alpinum]BDE07061.1 hypothetical protein WPS_23370 [Vulcanimicrobium alpinum]